MIYINITDASVEIIQTSKGLLNREEKITACSRKVLSVGVTLAVAISESLKTAYPSPIVQNQARVVIPDREIIINRLNTEPGKNDPEEVISQAKKILPLDISAYENYYKEIPGNTHNILFTALPLSVIKSYAEILKSCGLTMNFLSSSAFSVYALLKPRIQDKENLIYLHFAENLHFQVFDKEGPLAVYDKKTTAKNFNADLKTFIKKINQDHPAASSKLIFAGEKSLEIGKEELESHTGVSVLKIGTVLDEILASQKINIDTGGVPLIYFDRVIGLINLAKMTDVPNFAVDIKNIDHLDLAKIREPVKMAPVVPQESTEKENELDKSPEIPENPPPAVKMEVEEKEEPKLVPPVSPQSLVNQNIIEYSKPSLGSFFKNRILLIILFAAVSFLLFGGFLIIGQSQMKLPFISSPTVTPTVIPSPTITPTPTIDPALKRSDIKISVLNGTDKSGFAKENSEKLTTLGYKNIDLGNADRDDYSSTVIRIKDSKKNYLSLIINDLMNDFDTSTLDSLSEDDKSDVIIVLGLK